MKSVIQQRPRTKRHRKRLFRIKILTILALTFLVGVFGLIVRSVFFDKEPIFITPLAKDQSSDNSKLENELKIKNIEFESIATANDLSFVVKIKDNGEVLMSSKKSFSEQTSSLQLILSKLKIEGRTFRRLDFRYQKPTITF